MKPPHADVSGTFDERVKVVRFDDARGAPIGVVVSYGCHPTVAGQSTLIGPDYVGVARALVEKELPDASVLFFLGNCGDVRSRFVTDTGRFEWSYDPARVASAGEMVGLVAVEEVKAIDCKPQERLEIGSSQAHLTTTAGTALDGSPVTLVRVGSWQLLLTPAEVFTEVGTRIESQIGEYMPATLSDGYLGYIAPERAYDEGGYEVEESHRYFGHDSPLAKDSADRLVAAAAEAMRSAS